MGSIKITLREREISARRNFERDGTTLWRSNVLALEDQPDPGAPRTGDVRVRVRASSVNPVDGKVRRGELKLIAGGHFPKRPGLDFSGEVEAIGEDVSGIEVGDAVYGAARSMSEGAFAEYVLVHAAAIAKQLSTIDQTRASGKHG